MTGLPSPGVFREVEMPALPHHPPPAGVGAGYPDVVRQVVTGGEPSALALEGSTGEGKVD